MSNETFKNPTCRKAMKLTPRPNSDLSASAGSVPPIILPPLPKKETLQAPERREIRGYTAAQMMDYAAAAVSATWEQNRENSHREPSESVD